MKDPKKDYKKLGSSTSYSVCFFFLICSPLLSEIINERGSLRGFIEGECTNCLYDNYISHISEGIASEGYNIYAPDSIDVQTNGFGNYRIIPSQSETLPYWNNIFTHFIQNNFTSVEQMLSDSTESFNYNIVEFEDRTVDPLGWVWTFGLGPRFILLGMPWQLDCAWQYNLSLIHI